MLAGNPECLTPLLAQLRDCPMGRCWAWPDNTTPDMVPLERIGRWLWTSASITANRAQRWLETYAQCLKSGQWHSQIALEAHTWEAFMRSHQGGNWSCCTQALHHTPNHGTHFGCCRIPTSAQLGHWKLYPG